MQIMIKGRHWKPDPDFRDYAGKKIEKMVRYYPGLIAAELTITREGYRHLAELRLSGNGLKLMGSAEDPDPRAALDLVVEKQETALRRRKERYKDRKRRARGIEPEPVLMEAPRLLLRKVRPRFEIVRTCPRRPTLTAEQAARALLKGRKPLLVFTESGSERVRVVYRLDTGQVGLLELD